MSGILVSSTGNKKICCIFLQVFHDTLVFLEIFTTHLTMQCFKFFSTWIFTWIDLVLSHLWKQFQDEIVHQKTFAKKHLICFWHLVEDIKISNIFYKILNFLGTQWVLIITTYLIKHKHRALTKVFVEQPRLHRVC